MLRGNVALVTGASGGIGRAIALAYACNGARLALHYHGNREKAEKLRQEIMENGGEAEIFGCDVADFAACKEMIEAVTAHFGRIDILVNNAGITRDGLLMSMSEEAFDAVVDTNLKGCFNCMRFASRQMLRQRYGRILNISSVSGVAGNAGQANYAASKAGMIGLTKTAARELAARNVTVNAIAPGYVKTEMTDKLSDKVKEQILQQIPAGRFAEPEDIAGAAVFLASDQAAYITGQVLVVDGGMVM